MRPANIVRLGAVCAAVMVGACGFSPSKPPSGSAGSSGGTSSPIGGFGGAGATQAGQAGQGGNMSCGTVDRQSNKLPPDILIVLDRSGSMQQDPATGQNCTTPGCSKWDQTTSAINQVLGQTDTTVNWGLKLFGTNNGCTVSNMTENPVMPMNAMAIQTRIAGTTTGSNTPTRAGIQAATTYLAGLADPNPKFILVATDGSPNCPATCSGNNCNMTPNPAEEQAVVDAITAAAGMNIKTFVVGIATASDPDADMTLTNMANAGGVPRMGTPSYYPVASQADLVTALGQIVTVAASCIFPIPNPPTNDGTTSKGDIQVKGDNTVIPPLDPNNGWTYTDAAMSGIELHGSACDMVKAGNIQTVTIVFNCHVA